MKLTAGVIKVPPRMVERIVDRSTKELAAFWLGTTRKVIKDIEERFETSKVPALPKLGPKILKTVQDLSSHLYNKAEMEDVAEVHETLEIGRLGVDLVTFHDDVLPKFLSFKDLKGLDAKDLAVLKALLGALYKKYADDAMWKASSKLNVHLRALSPEGRKPLSPDVEEHLKERLVNLRELETFYAGKAGKPNTTTRRVWTEPVDVTGLPSNYPLSAVTEGHFKEINIQLLITIRDKKTVGSWQPLGNVLELVTPYFEDNRVASKISFQRILNELRSVLEHELQHMMQTIMHASVRMKKRKKLPEGADVPLSVGKRAGTPYGPGEAFPEQDGNAASKEAFRKANKGERYYLDPVEFYPQIQSAVDLFLEEAYHPDPGTLRARWKTYVTRSSNFFVVLLKHAKPLWKRAVGEGWKLVVERSKGGADSGKGKTMKTEAAVRRSAKMDSVTERLRGMRLSASARLALEEAAFLLSLMAMSLDQAREVLGLQSQSPSNEEIEKAWKKKALEHHPDRGGDPEKMKEVNVARDILTGERRPDRTPTTSAPSNQGTSYRPRTEYKPPERKTVTREQAVAPYKSVLADVKWLFRSSTNRSANSYHGDESSYTDTTVVFVGMKPAGDLIFLALRETHKSDYDGSGYAIATAKVLHGPDAAKLKEATTIGRRISEAIAAVGGAGRFNNKVYDLQGTTFDVNSSSWSYVHSAKKMRLKDWLVNQGVVDATEPSVANRKNTVIALYHDEGGYSTTRKTWVELIVNGKSEHLDENDMALLRKFSIMRFIFGYSYSNESKKTLNRIRDGKKIMTWMGKHLTSISDTTRAILLKEGAAQGAAEVPL